MKQYPQFSFLYEAMQAKRYRQAQMEFGKPFNSHLPRKIKIVPDGSYFELTVQATVREIY